VNGAGLAHGPLDHTCLFHRGPDELAAAMAEPLARAVDRGEAVLVSFDAATWEPLRDGLGPAAASVRWLQADDRYATPARAMTMLDQFVAEAVDGGAPAVWSVGALSFDGTERDHAWIRYEHAVNEVMADRPLHAVCSYDLDLVPEPVLAHAVASHRSHRGAVPVAACADEPAPAAPALPPETEAAICAEVETAASARSLVDRLDGAVSREVREDVRLVVSELVANAIRYGRPPVRLAVWLAPEGVVACVRDAGTGIRDRYADLRPPRPEGDGGRGLNIVAQLGQLHFGHDEAGASVVAVILPAADR